MVSHLLREAVELVLRSIDNDVSVAIEEDEEDHHGRSLVSVLECVRHGYSIEECCPDV